MSTDTTDKTGCPDYRRNYAYYRRFFKLPINYYHNLSYYKNIDNDHYYPKTDKEVQLDIKGRETTLCFLSPSQMKANALMGPSGTKLTKKQKWVLISKGGKLCEP